MLKTDQPVLHWSEQMEVFTSVRQVQGVCVTVSSRTIIQLDTSMNQRRRHMQQTEGQKTDKHRVEHAEGGRERERKKERIKTRDRQNGRQTDGRTDRQTDRERVTHLSLVRVSVSFSRDEELIKTPGSHMTSTRGLLSPQYLKSERDKTGNDITNTKLLFFFYVFWVQDIS